MNWPMTTTRKMPAAGLLLAAIILFTSCDSLTALDSFVLTVNNALVEGQIPDQAIAEDSTTPNLTLNSAKFKSVIDCQNDITAVSSNETLLPSNRIEISGPAPDCSVMASPLANSFGTTTITLKALDLGTQITIDEFTLAVQAVNDAPTISETTDQILGKGSITVPLTINDIDSQLSCQTSLKASTSPTLLKADSAIAFSGTAPNCLAHVDLAPVTSEVVTVTIVLSDDLGLTASSTFAIKPAGSASGLAISNIGDYVMSEDASPQDRKLRITGLAANIKCEDSLAATSSNKLVLLETHLAFTGLTPDCAIRISPPANSAGTTTVTVTAKDSQGHTASDAFSLTIKPINDGPAITNLANQNIDEDSTLGPLAFTINDPDSVLNCTTDVLAESSNSSLLGNANIKISGVAPNCVLTASPLANQNGSSTIRLTVKDSEGAMAQDDFLLAVTGVNDSPTISNLADQIVDEDVSTASLAITVEDVDSAISCTSSLTASSSNSTLLPAANIVFGGTAPNCTLTMTPAANLSGTVTITLRVDDDSGLFATDTVTLTVNPINDAPLIANVADLTIQEDSTTVAIAVSISDVDSILSCADSLKAISSNTALFPSAAFTIGVTAPACTINVTPTTNGSGKGLINLTVNDRSGQTSSGTFTVTVTPVNDPPFLTMAVPAKTISEDTTTGPLAVTINDNESPLNCTTSLFAIATNKELLPDGSIVIAGSAPDCTITVAPAASLSGTSDIALTVTDGAGLQTGYTFNLTVEAVNDAPVISTIPSQLLIPGYSSGPIPFTITDQEGPLNCTAVNVASTNQVPFGLATISVTGTQTNCSLTITPAKQIEGTSTITLSVTDGLNTTTTSFTATAAWPPFLHDAFPSIQISTPTPRLDLVKGDPLTDIVVALSTTVSEAVQLDLQVWGKSHASFPEISGAGPAKVIIPAGANSVALPIEYKSTSSHSGYGHIALVARAANQLVIDIGLYDAGSKFEFSALAAGERHSCAINKDGSLYCWGQNDFGQLGIGLPSTSSSTPVKIGIFSDWTHVATGRNHSCAIRGQQLYCWGQNNLGQIGDGTFAHSYTPKPVASAYGPWSGPMALGASHSCAINTDNSLHCWGSSIYGQLGTLSSTPVNYPSHIFLGDSWIKITTGSMHMCGITDVGQLRCWGTQIAGSGTLGINSTAATETKLPLAIHADVGASWIDVSAGANHTCAINKGRSVSCWGDNRFGQIGLGTAQAVYSAPTIVPSLSDVASLTAGSNSACTLSTDLKLSCWGSNSHGQIGNGAYGNMVLSPVAIDIGHSWDLVSVGNNFTCGVSEKRHYCWGSQENGMSATGIGTGMITTPKLIDNSTTWASVVTAENRACGLNAGQYYCWGREIYGELGNGGTASAVTSRPEPFPSDASSGITSALGQNHSCAITSNQLYCWGDNQFGQLGLGVDTPLQQSNPVMVGMRSDWQKIAAGAKHSCGIAGGALFCWGLTFPQPFNGGNPVTSPVPAQINLLLNWRAVATGGSHSCAIDSNNNLYCWGTNTQGQLGINSITNASAPTQVGANTSWTQVTAGQQHTCAIAQGILSCWGLNMGRSYLGEIISALTPRQIGLDNTWSYISAGGDTTCGINSQGLYCWGNNSYGQVGINPGGSYVSEPTLVSNDPNWSSVSVGSHNVIAIRNGQAFVWGDGYNHVSADLPINITPGIPAIPAIPPTPVIQP